MLHRLQNLFRPRIKPVTALEAITHVRAAVERLNISVVADDVDAGYDMAIDELIDILDDYKKLLSTPVVTIT